METFVSHIRILKIVRWLSAIVIFFVFLYIALQMIDPDLGWHLKVGEWIAANRAVPHFDIYSHTMPGFPWVNHEWLIDLLLSWMHTRGYEKMTALIFAIAAFLPFLIWLRRARSYLSVWLILIAAYGTIDFLGVRPQILSFLFFFLAYELIEAYRKRQGNSSKARFYLLALIPLFILWANLHAGFISGLVLFGLVFLVQHAVSWWRFSKVGKSVAFEIGVFLGSFGGTFLNPYGYQLYQLIFEALLSPETSKYIAEWASALSVFNMPNVILMAFLIFLSAKFFRRFSPEILGAAFFFFLMFLRSVRMWFVFLVPVIPLFEIGIERAREEIETAQKKRVPGTRVRAAFAGVIALLFLLGFGAIGHAVYAYETMKYPERAALFLKKEIAGGADITILNDYAWGGYLIDRVPEMKVFIDGRMPHWIAEDGTSAMRDYVKIFYTGRREDRREIFARRGINTVLIKNLPNETHDKNNLVSRLIRSYLPFEILIPARAREKAKEFFDNAAAGTNYIDLSKELTEAGWKVTYEDAIAAVFQCSGGCDK